MENLTTQERLQIFKRLSDGNLHLWSKGKLQQEKALPVFNDLLALGKEDPFFLAHLVSRENTKDLDVLSAVANFYTDADGGLLSDGFSKPDLRYVSQAKIVGMEPAMAYRTLWFSMQKFNDKRHLTRKSKEAFIKYLRYREINKTILEGAVKAGLKNKFMYMYRVLHISPSDEAVKLLGWKQKIDRGFEIEKKENPFEGLNNKQIAEKILNEKMSFQFAISSIENLTPVVAKSLVQVASPRQLVIYSATWNELGLFNDPGFVSFYEEKVASGKGDETDRIQDLEKLKGKAREIGEEVKETQRKKEFSQLEQFGIKKVFIHADFSGSLSSLSKEVSRIASIFAEMIPNPQENLRWGIFSEVGIELPLPEKTTQGGFESILYGKKMGGLTNTFALMKNSVDFGADLDVIITDGQHNCSGIGLSYKRKNVLVVKVGRWEPIYETLLKRNSNVVSTIEEKSLTNSAKVVESIATAIKGEVAVVDEIMNIPLLKLPDWWNEVPAK